LKDKSLAGKAAIFDVTVLEASTRTLPEITDEFAEKVRSGLTAESLKDELQKAVDSEDAKVYKPARNAAIAKALAEVMEVDVPDTLVTNQAREKFAMMMADMRNSGVADEEIKKQIKPENFLKYKKIVKDDIVRDFKVSMATDEIGRMEEIEVPDYQVEEQMESIKQEANEANEEFDEAQIRKRVAATLQREAVMDYLAENSNLEIDFKDDEEFDEALMERLAAESLAREEEEKGEEGESPAAAVATEPETIEAKIEPAEPETVTASAEVEPETAESEPVGASTEKRERDYTSMSVEEKAYYALLDSGALKSDQ
jgi:trigger factor